MLYSPQLFQGTKLTLAYMDMVIIMETVNAPMKDIVYRHNTKDGGAIRDAITRYFVEYL